jgi:hypothetical protein
MRTPFSLRASAAAVALLCTAAGAGAAPSAPASLQALVEQLNERMERLERRNAELERELGAQRAMPARGAPLPSQQRAIEQRIEVLEAQQARTAEALERDTLSEREPELTARLKAVEMQAQGAAIGARKIDALDGISAGFSLSTVAQKPLGAVAGSQLNYRGDAYVALPLADIGSIEQRVYTQFRIGQGAGLNDLPSFSKPNATAFRVLGGLRPDDAVAVLAQAWYQARIALPFGGHKPSSKETLEVTFGKMDPFVFFDQNAAANDETRQFANTVFVHNPLLDAGGDIGVDANGFTPGIHLAYANHADKQRNWRISLGVFGAGENGANYQRSLASPLVMLQAESALRLFGGLPGNYRIYAWRNGQATSFDEGVTAPQRHGGWGISADQRVGDGITLFGRYGRQTRGQVPFDRALTVGADVNGAYWDRSGDSIGLAAGWLKTSADYQAWSAAGGAERVAELYYRYRVGKQFELSPNLQYIGNPAGDARASAIKILGLRAQITY